MQDIDNDKHLNIDNSIDRSKYTYKKSFELRSEETFTAHKIATELGELCNYALYRKIVQMLGASEAIRLLKETQDDVRRGNEIGKPIRSPGALYNWKVRRLKKKKM